MAKRETEKKDSGKRESAIVTKESFCATGALFSLIAFLILCTRSAVFGSLGQTAHGFMLGFFGYFAYPLVLALGYCSCMGLFGKRLVKNRRLGTFVVLTIFSVGLIAHTGATYGWAQNGYLSKCFAAGENFPKSTPMGLFGGLFTYAVAYLTTKIGAILLFSVLTAFFLFLCVTSAKKSPSSAKNEVSQPVKTVEIPLSTPSSTETAYTQTPVTPTPVVTPNAQQNSFSERKTSSPYSDIRPNVTQRPGVSLFEGTQPTNGFSPFGAQTPSAHEAPRTYEDYENSRDFLFGGTPAENYKKNLLFDPTARVNQRPPVSPVQPAVTSEGYPSYADAYANAMNEGTIRPPVKVVDDRTDGFFRSETPQQSAPIEPPVFQPIEPLQEEPLAPQPPVFERESQPSEPTFSREENIFERNDQTQALSRGREDEGYHRHDYMQLFSSENPRIFGDEENPSVLSALDERAVAPSRDERLEEFDDRNDRRSDGLHLFDDEEDDTLLERGREEPTFEERGRGTEFTSSRSEFAREIPVEETRETPVSRAPVPPPVEEMPPEPKKPRVIRPYVRVPLDDFDCRDVEPTQNQDEVKEIKETIIATLEDFKVTNATIGSVTFGPTVTRYNVVLPRGTSPQKVVALDQSIAISLHSSGLNVYPNYDEGVVSIEVPNQKRQFVQLGSMLSGDTFVNASPSSLMFAMGKDVANRKIYGDVSKMIHMLVAGSSGSGKSVFLGSLIISLIYKYSPEELRLILIDPKKTEFVLYNDLPHLMINEIITDVQKTVQSLNWAIGEMNRRYELFEKMSRSGKYVVNLDQYNAQLEKNERLPKIVIIIDELADLMLAAKKEIEDRIQNLTQKARAAGIHLIVATQRPSTDVITGVIKSNLPTRIAFGVATDVDSRVILDQSGAQKLLGKGDFLYTMQGINTPVRVQSAFISPEDSQRVVNFTKQNNEAYYDEEATRYINNVKGGSGDDGGNASDRASVDPMCIEALRYVILSNSASISMIQRKCSAGYNRAGKIIEWMEDMGYISAFDGAKARKVLITKEEFESIYGPLQ